MEGNMWLTWYNHLLPPNSVCWRPDSWWKMISPASSYHPDIVNVTMVDGSVQTVSNDIDMDHLDGNGYPQWDANQELTSVLPGLGKAASLIVQQKAKVMAAR